MIAGWILAAISLFHINRHPEWDSWARWMRILESVIKHAEAHQGFVLFATSSLIGEGFDLPELDTLFLTLPISFKGRLIQYSGRLQRKSEDKSEVRIYDYVEPEHPLTSHMHRKRLSAFRGIGYEVAESPDRE